jgi:SAM-dependent methyltransferase
MSGPYAPDLYDTNTPGTFLGDIEWYRAKARERGGAVLELGAGTGRITLPIAQDGSRIHALEIDAGMREALERKLARLPGEVRERVTVVAADMRTFELSERFSLIIAPFRVFCYNLTDDDRMACLRRVRQHLLPGGHFAFNLFHPSLYYMAQAAGALEGVCQPSRWRTEAVSFAPNRTAMTPFANVSSRIIATSNSAPTARWNEHSFSGWSSPICTGPSSSTCWSARASSRFRYRVASTAGRSSATRTNS